MLAIIIAMHCKLAMAGGQAARHAWPHAACRTTLFYFACNAMACNANGNAMAMQCSSAMLPHWLPSRFNFPSSSYSGPPLLRRFLRLLLSSSSHNRDSNRVVTCNSTNSWLVTVCSHWWNESCNYHVDWHGSLSGFIYNFIQWWIIHVGSNFSVTSLCCVSLQIVSTVQF